MNSWGGRFDTVRVDINSSNHVKLSVFNAYNLQLIDGIKVTAYWLENGVGKTKSYSLSSNGSSLFTLIGTSGNNYSVIVPIGLEVSGVYSITYAFESCGEVIYSGTESAVLD